MTAFCVTNIKPNAKCPPGRQAKSCTVADGGRKWLQFEIKKGRFSKTGVVSRTKKIG